MEKLSNMKITLVKIEGGVCGFEVTSAKSVAGESGSDYSRVS